VLKHTETQQWTDLVRCEVLRLQRGSFRSVIEQIDWQQPKPFLLPDWQLVPAVNRCYAGAAITTQTETNDLEGEVNSKRRENNINVSCIRILADIAH